MGLLDIYNTALIQPSGYYQQTLNTLDPDLITNYPATVTGTPTVTQNPGGPLQNFDQHYESNHTYLDHIGTGGVLENTLKVTNLDVEDPRVQGGIPYNQLSDPTTYPANNVNHTSGIRGWFAAPATPPLKFNQVYNPSNTYVDFIGSI